MPEDKLKLLAPHQYDPQMSELERRQRRKERMSKLMDIYGPANRQPAIERPNIQREAKIAALDSLRDKAYDPNQMRLTEILGKGSMTDSDLSRLSDKERSYGQEFEDSMDKYIPPSKEKRGPLSLDDKNRIEEEFRNEGADFVMDEAKDEGLEIDSPFLPYYDDKTDRMYLFDVNGNIVGYR